ncbi:uncharacterized protein MYCFIDRAFT_209890 [Pseudocercospora fijiensis CIRAD86]|uniref:Uncharacterized protein n=1 Tax=Pseudocercospora fijiensis (strain CIRAD86) TaxID=383855 RepID=N1Q7P4_PSEFD|nr:uncharacterized protein MYCFIDRAFT_209890 [Pseudocercospora fijiensis CIRAD86]EME88750.1 hypothetical protein MYCFIDRAFT_209890 [Pseudocercospora fijiensis CIRAD86]
MRFNTISAPDSYMSTMNKINQLYKSPGCHPILPSILARHPSIFLYTSPTVQKSACSGEQYAVDQTTTGAIMVTEYAAAASVFNDPSRERSR